MQHAYGAALPAEIVAVIERGDFRKAEEALRRLSETSRGTPLHRACVDEIQILERIRRDYRIGEAGLLEEIKRDIPDISPGELREWAERGILESRVIDGDRRYFDRAALNLYRLSPEARGRREAFRDQQPAGDPGDAGKEFDLNGHMRRMLDLAARRGDGFVGPIGVRVDYAISVKPGKVPVGETVRCWMPMPIDGGQNRDVRIVRAEPEPLRASASATPHRSLYFERVVRSADEPIVFKATLELATSARVTRVDPARIRPYDESSGSYARYTEERRPHLELSPAIRELSSSIVDGETNPYLRAKLIFEWFDRNVTYTATPEYSTIPNISAYCLERRRGDCGIQALLFIALCRAAGIPARWQSGLTVIPGKPNLHDWAQFYVEPYGWLYADPSRGLRKSEDQEVRWFYFGNIDAYRLVVNEDYGGQFDPPKEHLRSETVDFQRGEVEWRGGNLYFSDWDYDWSVEYLGEP